MDHKTDFCPLKGLAEVAKRTLRPESKRSSLRLGVSRVSGEFQVSAVHARDANSPIITKGIDQIQKEFLSGFDFLVQ